VSAEAAASQFGSALFTQETAMSMEGDEAIFTSNTGVNTRYKMTEKSAEVEMCDVLHMDFNSQEKLLLNGVGVKLILRRSEPTFNLISYNTTKKFTVRLLDAVLFVRLAELSPTALLDTERRLLTDSVKYFLQRVEVKPFNVAKGQLYAIESNLFLGQQPNRVAMCMVETASYLGSLGKNPFNFQHFNMQSCCLSVNGKTTPLQVGVVMLLNVNQAFLTLRCIILQPYNFDFENKHFLQGYYSLFAQQGAAGHPRYGSLIKRADYNGWEE